MNTEERPHRRLDANDLDPCPSRACQIWHQAHGIPHDCQINIPHERRFQGARRWDTAA